MVRAGCVRSLVLLAADAGERCRRVAVSLLDVLSQVSIPFLGGAEGSLGDTL